MKHIAKLAVAAVAVILLAGCTGTITNKAGTCSEDYLLVPAISIPGAIGACDNK